ncbi:MAG: FAD-binding protein [Candidatus Dojkabacteria bacterium]|nr:FAD-binding protein [Candidatus Dojkabacteria bacterium]
MKSKIKKLIQKLNPSKTKILEPLAKYTTIGIGGPAEIFYEPTTKDELITAVRAARALEIPITMIGGGSNILVSDTGIKGIVIRNRSDKIRVFWKYNITKQQYIDTNNLKVKHRYQVTNTNIHSFSDLNYDESMYPRIKVYLESGVNMPYAINYLLSKGITGLQWYARIPGYLGGWIYNNTHGGTHLISELVDSVEVIDENNEIKNISNQECSFDYDKSRFHNTNEIILGATLNLFLGDVAKARYVLTEWAKKKSNQPINSPGCIFKNISDEDRQRLNLPTNSTGYIIEHILKLSELKIGNASISHTHHNFIVNNGKAKATDVLKIIGTIKQEAKKQLNLNLETEIFFLGFNKSELEEIY